MKQDKGWILGYWQTWAVFLSGAVALITDGVAMLCIAINTLTGIDEAWTITRHPVVDIWFGVVFIALGIIALSYCLYRLGKVMGNKY